MRKAILGLVLASSVVVGEPVAMAIDDGLVGPTWQIEMIKDAGTVDTGKATLVIAADGSVATSIGCNRMASKAAIDGNKITFSAVMSTRMACAPLIMKQEPIYGEALAATCSFEIGDGLLKFLDDKGTVVASFARGK